MTKIALVLHGNLRTFFMKMREYNFRVCDMFINNIIEPNNPDIFISTDTDDFFYKDAQYFCSDKINIMNGNTFRLFNKVNFISPDDAKNIIETELRAFFGDRLKGLIVNHYKEEDITDDPIYKTIADKTGFGYCPASLVGHYKKLYHAANLLDQYEISNNHQYDIIIKCRFDAVYTKDQKLFVSKYDYVNNDVYVPDYKPPFVHDWYGFGKRHGMLPYIRLYENLGFTLPNPIHVVECRHDGRIVYFGNEPSTHNKDRCQTCGRTDRLETANITMSSEHHIYSTFVKLKIRCQSSRYFTYIYRYRDINCSIPLEQAINDELKITNFTLVNHSPVNPISNKKY